MKKIILLLFFLVFISASNLYSQSGWQFVNPLPQHSSYAIRFFNTLTGYTVGEGGKILKTTNGAASWDFLSSNTSRSLYDIHLFNASTFLVAGDSGLVLYYDGNWSDRSPGTINSLKSLSFFNGNIGVIVGSRGTILKTTNAGQNWSIQMPSTKNNNCVFFLDAMNGFVVGDSGIFLKTTNGGDNWLVQNPLSVNLNCVWFINTNTGFIGTAYSNVLYKTTDSGLNWITQNSPVGDIRSFFFINSLTGYAVGRNSPIGRTTDAGNNWLNYGPWNLYPPCTLYDIYAPDTGNIYIAGNDGWLLKGPPVNNQWLQTGGTKFSLWSISFADANTGFITADYQTLLTTNGGVNWKVTAYGNNNWFEPPVTLFRKVRFSNPLNGYRSSISYSGIGGPSSIGIARSTNGGISWDGGMGFGAFFAGSIDICAVENSGIGVYVTIGTSYIVRSNSGANWSTIYTSPSPYHLTKISFATGNYGVVVGDSANSRNLIYRTTDAGSSWTRIYAPVSTRMRNIQMIPSGAGIITCDSGIVLRTNNFGLNWYVSSTNSAYNYGSFYFTNDNSGWSIINNNRIYFTSNGGASWLQQSIPSITNLQDVWFVDNNIGFVSGDSGVVLKTTTGGFTFISPVSNQIPAKYLLYQNYPNPFNPVSKIKFDVPSNVKRETSNVKVVIYDVLGREVAILVNEELKPGFYEVEWDATNFPSGLYFYKLIARDFTESRKMVLIK